jgi:hypothetical protein
MNELTPEREHEISEALVVSCLLGEMINRNLLRVARGESHLLQELEALAKQASVPMEEFSAYLQKRLSVTAGSIIRKETAREMNHAMARFLIIS